MQYLMMDTNEPCLRSEVWGISCEDTDCIDVSKPIGLSRCWPADTKWPSYDTVIHALADGWELMGPPTRHGYDSERGKKPYFTWWLRREVSS